MVCTSREKRPLDRKIPHLKDTRLIIIATEGKETEKHYFESDLLGKSRRVQVKVLPSLEGRSAPKYVARRLIEFEKRYDWWPGDQLWLMVDKDRWQEGTLKGDMP